MEKLEGQWWNPNHAGEGLFCTLDDDGRLSVAYFTHRDDGETDWFTFDCSKVGDRYEGKALHTTGGAMGVPVSERGKALTVLVGSARFEPITPEGGDPSSWLFVADIRGEIVEYPIMRLFPNPQAIEETPPPEPEPEIPPNPFESKLKFWLRGHKVPDFHEGEFKFEQGQWWLEWNTTQIPHRTLRAGRSTVLDVRIEALEEIRGLRFTVSPGGYGNPSWVGDLPQTIPAGETIDARCRLTKGDAPQGHDNAHFQINSELGELMRWTARILSR